MKMTFEWPVRTLSGTRDKTTFMSMYDDYICIARRWVEPAATPQQENIKAISQNLRIVWSSANPLYKEDFTKYAAKFKQEKLKPWEFPPRAYSIFLSLMYAWRDSDPAHVDLTTVTVADIVALDASVRTVKRSVEAEFIVPVSNYETLDNDIQ
jgi:hypothetical protein